MAKMIAYCGINCSSCPAFIATQKDDQKGLAKTAAKWSKLFKMKIKPEDVVCDGCLEGDGRKAAYCSTCEIRACCLGKGKENCAFCAEYVCQKLEDFLKHAPEAKKNLEKVKKGA